jgi:hypothetical protein
MKSKCMDTFVNEEKQWANEGMDEQIKWCVEKNECKNPINDIIRKWRDKRSKLKDAKRKWMNAMNKWRDEKLIWRDAMNKSRNSKTYQGCDENIKECKYQMNRYNEQGDARMRWANEKMRRKNEGI